jgi:hypothetical protein
MFSKYFFPGPLEVAIAVKDLFWVQAVPQEAVITLIDDPTHKVRMQPAKVILSEAAKESFDLYASYEAAAKSLLQRGDDAPRNYHVSRPRDDKVGRNQIRLFSKRSRLAFHERHVADQHWSPIDTKCADNGRGGAVRG